MVSTWVKLSHRDWISITPRKAAKMYQVANWCLRSSGSLGGFLAFGSTAVSRLLPKPRNCRKRQPGAGSMSLVVLSNMSVSCAGAAWATIEDAGCPVLDILDAGRQSKTIYPMSDAPVG